MRGGVPAGAVRSAAGRVGLSAVAVSATALHEGLAAIVGRDHLLEDPSRLGAYAVDGHVPRWVAWPAAADEASRLLALAQAERLAVAPRGGGSSLGLGRPPRRLDLVLDLSRLDGVIEHAPADQIVTAQCGLRLAALGRALGPHRQRLPLDPLGAGARSVGGVLATGASGPLRYRFGGPRDLLLGVRFLQADGMVTWGGSKVVKSVSGYDLPKLLVGSLGTLGVVVEATLRLHPVPAATGSWLSTFPSLERAGEFLAGVLASPLEPERLVLLAGGAATALGMGGAPAAVAAGVGGVAEAVESQGGRLVALAREAGGESSRAPEEIWDATGEGLDAPLRLELAGEPRRLAHWASELERLTGRLGLESSALGEAGSGVLRAALRGPAAARSLDTGLLRPLRGALEALGGSVVVERCPTDWKATIDVWGPVPAERLAVMARIKAEFDPSGVLNPGRFVGGL